MLVISDTAARPALKADIAVEHIDAADGTLSYCGIFRHAFTPSTAYRAQGV